MKKMLENAVNYFYVGVVPNSVNVALTGSAAYLIAEGRPSLLLFYPLVMIPNAAIASNLYDGYNKLKGLLEKRGWHEALVKPKALSWCQRHATKQVAKQLGYLDEFNSLMEQEGHKWYHFLPKSRQ